MKYFIRVWLLLLFSVIAGKMYAQTLAGAEYFFNTDPGAGKGTPFSITPGDTVLATVSIPASGVPAGFNQLYIRFKNNLNQWGIAEQRTFYIDAGFSTGAAKIKAAEYFFDTDPGAGKGTPIAVTTTDSVSIVAAIQATGVPQGFHQLFVRFQNANGSWSIAEQRVFYVDNSLQSAASKLTAGEYFIDTDPGVGKALPFAVTKTDSINTTLNLSFGAIANGFHQLFIRCEDSSGKWGIAEQRVFFLDSGLLQKAAPLITGEYFFTKDSGVGKGQSLLFTKTDSLNKSLKIVVPSLSLGNQFLEIRIKDSSGRWSIAEGRKIKIVCKPDLGKDTTVKVCLGSTTDITGLYDYVNYASYQWNTLNPASVGVGSYRLIVTSSLGCSDTAIVTVSANPKPALGKDTVISKCIGSAVNLTLLYNTTGLTTQWSTPRPDSVVTPGSYTLIAINSFGCSDTAMVTINDYPLPTATITAGGPTTFCQGDSVTLTSSAATAYLWSTGATTPSIKIKTGGNYTVKVTNATGCSNTSAATTVTVNALPTATITAGGPTGFCQGDSVILTSSSGTAYLWSTGATTQSITVKTGANYTVKVTNATGCSSTSAATTVTVNALPTATITAGGATTFCQGDSVILTSSSGTAYLWSTGVTTQSITVKTGAGYTVKVTNASGCSNTSAATTVTVNASPTATITANSPTTFCQGDSVTLISSAGTTYLWSTGATAKNIKVKTGGSYTVTVTNAGGCSKTSAPTIVTVNALPTATITAGGPTTFCQGGSVTLTASAGSSYLWSTGETTQSISVATGGNYTVKVTNAGGCSKTSAPTTVTVNVLSTATITAGGPTTFCQGGSVTLTASAGSSYLWSTGATTQSISVNTGGNYTVTVTNASGCSNTSAATTVTVNANPAPTTTPSGNVNINQGSTVTINVNGTYSSYLWSTGATTPGITTGTAGSYSVAVTNAGGCSGTSAPVTVTVVSSCKKPTITAAGSTSNVCPGKTVKLTSSTASSYLWSTGETTRSINAAAAGSYTVTTGTGCTSDATVVTYTGCADPTGLAAGSITSTSAVLSWTTMPCATKYTVQYRQVGTTAWTTVTVTVPSLALTGLIAGTQYQWTLLATCSSTSKSAKITGPKFTTSSALQSVEIASAQLSELSAKLFPNPATDHALLQISGAKGKVSVIITDMDGKTLWRSDNVISQVELPLANFSNGTYLVNIITGEEIKKLKLVKAK